MQGYEALRTQAARFPLDLGLIRVTGEDRVRLLHAMTTNHVEALASGGSCYAFFLNAQGRVLADAYLFAQPEFLLVATEAAQRQSLYEHIDRYIIADDVTLEDATAELVATAIEGPQATAPQVPGFYGKASRTALPGYWLFTTEAPELPGLPEADAEAVEMVRLENGRPLYGVDFSDANIAHETRQMHAISFNKGCYLGQEIVERVRSRGHVNRQLTALRIDGQQPPERGTKVLAGEKEIGEITSAAFSPALNVTCALALLRAEAAAAELSVNRARARAAAPVPNAGC